MASRKPRLTDKVLQGINEAICRMEADDLTSLDEKTNAEFLAASEWIRKTFAHRNEKANRKAADNASGK